MKSIAGFLMVALIWLAGLAAFAGRVEQSTPARDPEGADAAVALTGANSKERIAAAVRLLELERARRVLVSGVNREASREDIRALTGPAQRLYDCCVDLGFDAADTVGNARETLAWANQHGYQSLIVVTSDYHMPRAMLELRAVMPKSRMRLETHAVATASLRGKSWWRDPGAARMMVVEYCKYLAILGREAFLGLGPRPPAPTPQPSKVQP
jgi:uncharacterized SAM-binding protein YcdF (DUF218 family)